jgi:hypothetical protein
VAIQQSKHSLDITSAAFEAAFDNFIFRFGAKGIILKDAPDALDANQYSRLSNFTHRQDFSITGRRGLTEFATGGDNVHTIRRLNNPGSDSYIRVFGIDGDLYYGTTGALTLADTGYSGRPMYMVPYRPPLSSETWMFVADSTRMRKMRTDGLDLPIGLPAPASAPTTVLGAKQTVNIANFTSDETVYSAWTSNPGFQYDVNGNISSTPIVTPFTTDVQDPNGGTGIDFETWGPPAVYGDYGYYAFWGVHRNMDLSTINGAATDDDDYFHVWLNFSHPHLIDEFRVYLVCSTDYNPEVLPGEPNVDGANQDAYFKAISGHDLATFVSGAVSQVDASEEARIKKLRDDILKDIADGDGWVQSQK